MNPPSFPKGYNYPSKSYAVRTPVSDEASADSNSLGHQLARVSWIAPLIVMVFGICTMGVPQKEQTTHTIILITKSIILGAGIIAGIVALCGTKRWGSDGVFYPAISGLGTALFGGLLFASLLSPNRSSSKPFQPSPRTALRPEHAREAFLEAGWLGALSYNKAEIQILTIIDDCTLSRELRRDLATPTSLAIVSARNSGKIPLRIDTSGAVIYLKDGRSIAALNPVTVLQSAKKDRVNIVNQFSPPFIVGPGEELNGMFLFLPPGTPAAQIKSITLKVDYNPRVFQGQFFTATEKAKLLDFANNR